MERMNVYKNTHMSATIWGMGSRINKLWKFGSTVVSWLLLIASAPTKFTPLLPVYDFFSKHWTHLWFRLCIALVATVLIYIFEIVDYFRPMVRVKLMPSGKASSDLVLRVTNVARQGNFKATCEVIGSRETCGIPLNKTVNLKWEGANSPQIGIAPNASESLFIASHEYDMPRNTSWLRLWGLDGQDKKQLVSAAWTRTPTEKLPEIDLKLSIFREGSIKPEIKYFTIRPESYIGPLEMFSSEVTA
jgi:hypothetical protein